MLSIGKILRITLESFELNQTTHSAPMSIKCWLYSMLSMVLCTLCRNRKKNDGIQKKQTTTLLHIEDI